MSIIIEALQVCEAFVNKLDTRRWVIRRSAQTDGGSVEIELFWGNLFGCNAGRPNHPEVTSRCQYNPRQFSQFVDALAQCTVDNAQLLKQAKPVFSGGAEEPYLFEVLERWATLDPGRSWQFYRDTAVTKTNHVNRLCLELSADKRVFASMMNGMHDDDPLRLESGLAKCLGDLERMLRNARYERTIPEIMADYPGFKCEIEWDPKLRLPEVIVRGPGEQARFHVPPGEPVNQMLIEQLEAVKRRVEEFRSAAAGVH